MARGKRRGDRQASVEPDSRGRVGPQQRGAEKSSRRRSAKRSGPPPSRSRAVASTAGSAAGYLRSHQAATLLGAFVVIAAFALYVATAARDIVFGDSPELAAVALTWGVAHPPGYPIFTDLGWIFGQLPVGPLPFRVALLSAVAHSATVGIVYVTTYRFARSVPAAVVSAAVLATAPLFWRWSLVPEVFPLNDLAAATMLLLVALWHEHPERRGLLTAGALVGGLGMSNHQTIALLAPAVFYVLWRRRRPLLRDMALVRQCALAFALGLIPYLQLPVAALHQPAWNWGDIHTPGDLIAQFLRKSYGTAQLLTEQQFTGGSLVDRVATLFTALDPLQMVLLVVGAAYAFYRLRWYAIYLLTVFTVAGPAFTAYSNANVSDETTRSVLERFFLLPHVAVAPLAGFAVLAAGDALARLRIPRPLGAAVVGAITTAAALILVPMSYRDIDQSNNHVARIFGEDLLATLKPNTVFLAGGDPVVFSVGYLQTIEGARPDVTTVQIPLVPADWYIRELKRMHPELAVPYDTFGPGGGPIRSLIDANKKRPIAAIGDLPDNSTDNVYWFYSRGMVFEVRAVADTVTLDDMVAENEPILAMYRPSRYADLPPSRVWERLTLVDYALGYYRVGHEYERGADSLKKTDPKRAADLYQNARSWYQRALAVNPTLIEAKDGLGRLPQ